MNGLELKACLNKFPNLKTHFKGIYFIDNLPTFLKKFSFIICNTDLKNGLGKHWIAFIHLKNHIECFDSLGINSDKKLLLEKYCRFKNVTEVIYNETQFQDLDSTACGKFVLYFIIERFFNLDLDFQDLLSESFSFDLNENETKINQFYLEHFA